ncbi:MAG: hypothetical protein LBD98_04720 [Endomicrobium sp.]|jgi:hypothetical protein|nr:hypothetical protein [Endomicrobium sp.]
MYPGGLYYAIGLGCEFSFGLILEITHSRYKYSGTDGKSTYYYKYGDFSRFDRPINTLSLGYKFKI